MADRPGRHRDIFHAWPADLGLGLVAFLGDQHPHVGQVHS